MKPLQKEKNNVFIRKLGYNIMCIRLEKGIDLLSVSNALNISAYVLKNIEKGKYKTLKFSALIRLARYYKEDLIVFLEGV